jgi:hypothetical protein
MIGATAKIHLNRLFSEPINIERGVRQGDPLAPMLFALSTQPLLAYIEAGLKSGSIPGIPISNTLNVAHRLFADDMGIMIPATEEAFNSIRQALSEYEQASGAKLNIQKTIIVPIALQTIPRWITQIGCKVADAREITKYLGAPFGTRLSTQAVQTFCLDRLANKIVKLKLQSLSFTSRLLVLKHILHAMPVYHLMYTRFPKSTQIRVQRICAAFLWGYNQSGGSKTHLVAWNRLTRLKKHGGLGIKNLPIQNTALLARWPIQLLTKPDSEWSQTMQASLDQLPWSNRKIQRKNGYTFLDRILFSKPTGFRKLEYAKSIWKAWELIWPKLKYRF